MTPDTTKLTDIEYITKLRQQLAESIPKSKVQKAIEKLQEMKPCYTDDGMQNYNIDFAKRILDELLSEGKEVRDI